MSTPATNDFVDALQAGFLAENQSALDALERIKTEIKPLQSTSPMHDWWWKAPVILSCEMNEKGKLFIELGPMPLTQQLPNLDKLLRTNYHFPVYPDLIPDDRAIYYDMRPCWKLCQTVEERLSLIAYTHSVACLFKQVLDDYAFYLNVTNRIRTLFGIPAGRYCWKSSTHVNRSIRSISYHAQTGSKEETMRAERLLTLLHEDMNPQ